VTPSEIAKALTQSQKDCLLTMDILQPHETLELMALGLISAPGGGMWFKRTQMGRAVVAQLEKDDPFIGSQQLQQLRLDDDEALLFTWIWIGIGVAAGLGIIGLVAMVVWWV
jgi:hypothetical protein